MYSRKNAVGDSSLRPKQTGRNIYGPIVFDSGPFAPLCKNMTLLTKPEVQNIAVNSKEDRATARGSMYRKCWNLDVFLRYVSGQRNRQTDRQTDRHADCNTSHPYQGQRNKLICQHSSCLRTYLVSFVDLRKTVRV